MTNKLQSLTTEPEVITVSGLSRRNALKSFGLVALGAGLLTACKDDEETAPGATEVNLGGGDTGILNYAYALEQLEAAFYVAVVSNNSFGTIFSAMEQQALRDIRDHEVIHREFFKTALGSNAIPGLSVNFSSINFSDRMSVLNGAKTFEDLGVAAYNGAGKLLISSDLLTVAGKIVSVEARHAAAIRDFLQPNTAFFAGDDAVDTNGFDKALLPDVVLAAAAPYLTTKITGKDLPKA